MGSLHVPTICTCGYSNIQFVIQPAPASPQITTISNHIKEIINATHKY